MSGKHLTEKSGRRELCKPDYPVFDSQNPYKKQAVVVHTCDLSFPKEGWGMETELPGSCWAD